jgi:hypothetical protein
MLFEKQDSNIKSKTYLAQKGGKTMIEKTELVEAIARKINISGDEALSMVNEVIAEMVSPSIFGTPGESVGFINDNNCRNNCKEALALREQAIQR